MPSKKKLVILATEIRKTQEELMDFLLEKHPSEFMVIEGARGFFKGKTDVEVYKYIQDSVFPHSVNIKAHNLDFFKERKNDLFKGLPHRYIDTYADLIINSPNEDIERIWSYFEVLVQIFEVSLKSKKNR